jgi:hypothetical protein
MYRRELTRLLLVEGQSIFRDCLVESMKGNKSFLYLNVAEKVFPIELKYILDKEKVIDMFFRYKSEYMRDYVRNNSNILFEMINHCDRNLPEICKYYNNDTYQLMERICIKLSPTYEFIDASLSVPEKTSRLSTPDILPKHLGETNTETVSYSSLLWYLYNSSAKINYSLVQNDIQSAYMLGLKKHPNYNLDLNYDYSYTDNSFDKLISHYDIPVTLRYNIQEFSVIDEVCQILFGNVYKSDKVQYERSELANDKRLYNVITDEIDKTEDEISETIINADREFNLVITDKSTITDVSNINRDYVGLLICRSAQLAPHFHIDHMFLSISECFRYYMDNMEHLQYDVLKYIIKISTIETIKLFTGLFPRRLHLVVLDHHKDYYPHNEKLALEQILKLLQV